VRSLIIACAAVATLIGGSALAQDRYQDGGDHHRGGGFEHRGGGGHWGGGYRRHGGYGGPGVVIVERGYGYGPRYHGAPRSGWWRHVRRCEARYGSYNPRTDRYVVRRGVTARCYL
jgi:hypothetical protein